MSLISRDSFHHTMRTLLLLCCQLLCGMFVQFQITVAESFRTSVLYDQILLASERGKNARLIPLE